MILLSVSSLGQLEYLIPVKLLGFDLGLELGWGDQLTTYNICVSNLLESLFCHGDYGGDMPDKFDRLEGVNFTGKKMSQPLDPADRGIHLIVGSMMYTSNQVPRSGISSYSYIFYGNQDLWAVYQTIAVQEEDIIEHTSGYELPKTKLSSMVDYQNIPKIVSNSQPTGGRKRCLNAFDLIHYFDIADKMTYNYNHTTKQYTRCGLT